MAAASSSPLVCPGARLGRAGASLQGGGLAETGLRCRLSHQVTQTLQWAVRSWTDLESSIVSVERMKDYARTPKEVTGGRRGRGRVSPGLTAEGSGPRSTSATGFGAPTMVDQSPSQGHGQEHGVWSRVKSWFLRFLTWARRGILLSDRDVRDSNATTAMSQRHGRNRRALWPLTMLGDLGGSHEVSAKDLALRECSVHVHCSY